MTDVWTAMDKSTDRNSQRCSRSLWRSAFVIVNISVYCFSYGCTVLRSTQVTLQNPAPKKLQENKLAYFLPTSQIRLRLSPFVDFSGKPTNVCNLEILTEYIPDTKNLFFVDYLPSTFSDDNKVKVEVNKKGLLQKVESDTTDQTPKIAAQLGELARAILKIPAPTTPGLRAASEEDRLTECQWEMVVDPFCNRECQEKTKVLESLNRAMPKRRILRRGEKADPPKPAEPIFKVAYWETQLIGVPPPASDPQPPAHWSNPPCQRKGWPTRLLGGWSYDPSDCQTGGIFYRPLLPYRFIMKYKSRLLPDGDREQQFETIVYLPNRAPILSFDIYRRAFVNNSYTIEFEDGVLKSIEWKKPSEAVGFLNIPIDIARAITSIPGQLLTVKVQSTQAERELLEAQKNLMEEQLNLLRKQQELEAAKQPTQNSPTP